jgi:serine/threonine protein phosphatase 1
MQPRTIAIGDIHGCSRALNALLAAIDPRPDDVIVTLGDYINRGPDSRGVLDRLIALEGQCTLVPILGNHDQTLLSAVNGERRGLSDLLDMGGRATFASYDAGRTTEANPSEITSEHIASLRRHRPSQDRERFLLERIPAEHIAFLQRCRDYYETETHLFLHAQYDPGLAMEDQPPYLSRWESLRNGTPGPHDSGKTAIVGHSSQKSGEILDLGHLVCIDTFCYGGGWLTALDVRTDEVWQVNQEGELRLPRSG